jgi:L-phenylalanine/L-methionine N-acetyltransferase
LVGKWKSHSERDDIKAIKQIYEQPVCYSGTLQLPYPSEALWEKRLSDVPDNFYSLVAVAGEHVVGQIGLQVFSSPRRKHVANIGMAVSAEFQNKGIGSKLVSAALDLAFNWLSVKRIELEVYTDNEAAIKLYKKHGFSVEGTARAYAFKNGEYVDVYLMAKINA